MNEFIGQLPEDVDELQALLRAQARHYEQQLAQRDQLLKQRDGTIEQLRAQINVLLAKRFGASAEKVSEAQLGLFNEAEVEAHAGEETEEAGTVVAAHRRGAPKRKPLPDILARVDVEHPLPESERRCAHHVR